MCPAPPGVGAFAWHEKARRQHAPRQHQIRTTTGSRTPRGTSSKPGWKYTAKSAFAEFQRDQCTDLAAALTYYSVLSVFPAILALVSLLGFFGQGESTTTQLLDIIRQLGQEQVATQLEKPITEIVNARGRRPRPGDRARGCDLVGLGLRGRLRAGR